MVAQLAAQRGGDHAQLLVAGLVAALVVDGLEVVEVDQQAGERRPGAARAGDLLARAQVQRAVVDQPGERVGGGGDARRAGRPRRCGRPRPRARRSPRSVRRSSSVTRRISVKPTDSAPLSSPFHTIGTPAAVWMPPSDSWAVSISVWYALVTNGSPGRQHAPGDALAAAEDDPGPAPGRRCGRPWRRRRPTRRRGRRRPARRPWRGRLRARTSRAPRRARATTPRATAARLSAASRSARAARRCSDSSRASAAAAWLASVSARAIASASKSRGSWLMRMAT